MTTIATDGKTMAADTRQVAAYIDQIESKKLFRVNGIVYGFAGINAEYLTYIEWIKGGRDKDNKPNLGEDWNCLFVKNGSVWWEDNNLQPVETGAPRTIGSGGRFAMGAMLAGATPTQAVKVAMKLDPDTGGKVRTMKC